VRALRSSIRIAQVDGKYVPAIIAPIYIVDAQIAVCVMSGGHAGRSFAVTL